MKKLNHSREITYWNNEKFKEKEDKQIKHQQMLLKAKKKRSIDMGPKKPCNCLL